MPGAYRPGRRAPATARITASSSRRPVRLRCRSAVSPRFRAVARRPAWPCRTSAARRAPSSSSRATGASLVVGPGPRVAGGRGVHWPGMPEGVGVLDVGRCPGPPSRRPDRRRGHRGGRSGVECQRRADLAEHRAAERHQRHRRSLVPQPQYVLCDGVQRASSILVWPTGNTPVTCAVGLHGASSLRRTRIFLPRSSGRPSSRRMAPGTALARSRPHPNCRRSRVSLTRLG